MKHIVILNANRLDNIGDAFYRFPLAKDLELVYGSQASIHLGEGLPVPQQEALWSREPAFDYAQYALADWLVLSGPVFHKGYPDLMRPILRPAVERGAKLAFLSVGGHAYDAEETATCRSWLKEFPPHVFTSRDSATFEAYSDLAEYAHDGVCSAFFSSIHYPGFDTPDLDPYVVLGFEASTEPQLRRRRSVEGEDDWTVDTRRVRAMSRVERLFDSFRRYSSSVDGVRIVRPLHGPMGYISSRIFNRPNRFISLNAESYLNLYRNADATFSMRVHACVAALSYGGRAMLCTSTGRDRLFDRAGVTGITAGLRQLPPGLLEREHDRFIQFLASVPL